MWWLAVNTATGKPIRRITQGKVVVDDQGKPIGLIPTKLPEESAIELPDTVTIEELAFATFNITSRSFEFEPHHYICVDKSTGQVVGDVVSTKPIIGARAHDIYDVTDLQPNKQHQVGKYNGQFYDKNRRTFEKRK